MSRVKLTDKQKKKIIADYIENNNYSETARMNNVSDKTVKRLVVSDKNKEVVKKVEQKKEQNTQDILDYMDELKEEQKEIIQLSLKALKSKLKKPDMLTTVKDIATVYGVIYDKALKTKEMKLKNNTESNKKVVIVNDLPRE